MVPLSLYGSVFLAISTKEERTAARQKKVKLERYRLDIDYTVNELISQMTIARNRGDIKPLALFDAIEMAEAFRRLKLAASYLPSFDPDAEVEPAEETKPLNLDHADILPSLPNRGWAS